MLKDVDVPPVILPDVPTVSAPETANDDKEPDVAVIAPLNVPLPSIVKSVPLNDNLFFRLNCPVSSK